MAVLLPLTRVTVRCVLWRTVRTLMRVVHGSPISRRDRLRSGYQGVAFTTGRRVCNSKHVRETDRKVIKIPPRPRLNARRFLELTKAGTTCRVMAHDAVKKVGALIVMALPIPCCLDKAKFLIWVKASRVVKDSDHAFSVNVCGPVCGNIGASGSHLPDTSTEWLSGDEDDPDLRLGGNDAALENGKLTPLNCVGESPDRLSAPLHLPHADEA